MSFEKIQQINKTLEQIKSSISNKKMTIKNRKKNKEFLLKLGWIPEQALEEILTLTYKNYSRGPEKNISSSGS